MERRGEETRALAPRRADGLLFMARLLAQTAETSCYFVGILGVAAYTLGSSAYGIAAMMLIANGFMVVGYSFAGSIVDTLGPRRVVMGSALAIACANLGYQAMPDTLFSLGLITAVRGMFLGVQSTAFTAFPPYIVAPSRLQRANGLLGAASNVAMIAGPFLGGLMVLGTEPRTVFYFGAALELAAIAAAYPLLEDAEATREVARQRARQADEAPQGVRGAVTYAWEGVRATLASPSLRTLLLMGFVGFFAYGAFDSLESLYYRDVLQVGPEWLGWLSAAAGIGTLGGSLIMLKLPDRWLTLRGMAVMLAITGAGTVLYVATDNVWVACTGQIVLGLGFGALEPTQNLLVQRFSDLSVVGRVLSVVKIGYQFAGVAPLLAAPFLADAFGVQAVLVSAGAIVLVAGLAFTAGIRPSRHPSPGGLEAAGDEQARG